jgi:DNA polymerase-3 subunit beta
MRLTCLQENLSRGLGVVGRAVATRTTLPITQHVLLSTDRSRLKLSATNLQIAISTWVGAQVEEEGAITIPARLLTDFVNSLPNERVDVDAMEQPKGLSFRCARFEANINGTDAEDFPPIPSVEDGVVCRIDADVLRKAISHVEFAAATEDSRPVLTGIKVEASGDGFTFAAADGFRLAVYKGKLAEPLDGELDFIIPSRAMQEVNRLIGSQQEQVEFTVTTARSQALFKLENVELTSQLIQGTFPNYGQLIPETWGTRVVVDLNQFSQATKSTSIFARDGSGIVRLQISEPSEDSDMGRVSISSRAEELGENQGEIDGQVEGDEAKIAFNSKYLVDVLEVLEEGKVALETTTPSSPGVIRPVVVEDGAESTDDYVHVVMPMFVQW